MILVEARSKDLKKWKAGSSYFLLRYPSHVAQRMPVSKRPRGVFIDRPSEESMTFGPLFPLDIAAERLWDDMGFDKLGAPTTKPVTYFHGYQLRRGREGHLGLLGHGCM